MAVYNIDGINIDDSASQEAINNAISGMSIRALKSVPSGATTLKDFNQCGVYFFQNILTYTDAAASGIWNTNTRTIMTVDTANNNLDRLYTVYALNGTPNNRVVYGYLPSGGSAILWAVNVTGADMPFCGHNVCLLGDSIANGANSYIGKKLKKVGNKFTNKSVGGSYISNSSIGQATIHLVDCVKSSYSGQNKVEVTDYDTFIIWAGTNDWGNGVSTGTIGNNDETTIIGGLESIFNSIWTQNPGARIVVFTPTRRWSDNSSSGDADDGSLAVLGEAIEALCKTYNVPVCNMFENSPINKANKASLMASDGLHPNATGYEIIGEFVGRRAMTMF